MTSEGIDHDRVALEKRAARAVVRAGIARLSPAARALASARVCQRLMAMPEFLGARCVMLFAPMSEEVDLTPVMERLARSGRLACVPRMDWDARTMEPAQIGPLGWADLVPTRYGLREPAPTARRVDPSEIDVVIVPGVAFDAACHRLGRGGGFYDRFLARPELRRAFLLGVGYAVQLVDRVPRTDLDRPVNAVVTDDRLVIRRPAGEPR